MMTEQGLEERNIHVNQWFPYQDRDHLPTAEESLMATLKYLETHNLDVLHATTALMIAATALSEIARIITNGT